MTNLYENRKNTSFDSIFSHTEMADSTYRRVYELPRPDQAKSKYNIHVCLIVPPSPFVVPCGWEWIHRAPFEGPSIIASLLKGLGYQVTLLDQREDFNPESLKGRLANYDIVCITCYEDNYPYLKRVAEIAKEDQPQKPVILGGPLVTSAPKVMLKDMVANYAVVGEGELTLTELMDHITENEHARPIESIKGLAWKNGEGDVIVNPKRPQMKNLDAVPIQDFSVWDRFKGGDIPEIYMMYGRGCFANCSFCYRAFPQLSYKSIKRVRDEIRFYKQYNFKMVWWSDLTFVTDKNYINELLDVAMSEHEFRWNCFNRVDTADLELYNKMRGRGCDIILYGLESVAPDILKGYRKGTNKDKIINALQITKQAGIKCGGLFIVGAPDETKETLDHLINFCREFREVTRVKYLSIIPGTQDYYDAIKRGIITDEVAHLHWLASERSIEEDIDHPEFVKVADKVTKEDLKRTYHIVNTLIEQRPYDYSTPANVFLEEDNKIVFDKRPLARK